MLAAGRKEVARWGGCVKGWPQSLHVRVLGLAARLASGPEDESLGAAAVTEVLASLWMLRCSPPSLGSGLPFCFPQTAFGIPTPFSWCPGAARRAGERRSGAVCWEPGGQRGGPAIACWRRALEHMVMLM